MLHLAQSFPAWSKAVGEPCQHVLGDGEEHAHNFLQHPGSCTFWVHSTRTNYKPTPYRMCGELCDEISLKDRIQGIGFSMIVHLLTLCCLAGNIAVIPHLPYSPHLAPRDTFLFPKLKMILKGRRLNDVTMI